MHGNDMHLEHVHNNDFIPRIYNINHPQFLKRIRKSGWEASFLPTLITLEIGAAPGLALLRCGLPRLTGSQANERLRLSQLRALINGALRRGKNRLCNLVEPMPAGDRTSHGNIRPFRPGCAENRTDVYHFPSFRSLSPSANCSRS